MGTVNTQQKLLAAIYQFMDENDGRRPSKLIVRKDIVQRIMDELPPRIRELREKEQEEYIRKGLSFFTSFDGIPMEIVDTHQPGVVVPEWVLKLDNIKGENYE